eukprot:601410-Pleurochrysis_carterae.AAC.1
MYSIASGASPPSPRQALRSKCACTTSTKATHGRGARARSHNGKMERLAVGYFQTLPPTEQKAA